MTRDELVANLGTIAHSGSLEFLKKRSRPGRRRADAIADRPVRRRVLLGFHDRRQRAGPDPELQGGAGGWEWESDGSGTFPSRPPRGWRAAPRSSSTSRTTPRTSPTIGGSRRRCGSIRASSRIQSRSVARSSTARSRSGSSPGARSPRNSTRQFYQHLTHHAEEKPLWHLHLAADSPIQFRAILYCPPTNVELLGFGARSMGSTSAPSGSSSSTTAASWCPSTSGSSTAWSIRRTCR